MNTLTIAALTSILLGATGLTHAAKPCSHLEGAARTQCLQQEVRRGQQETASIHKRVKRLDRAIAIACTADKVGRHAAAGAARGGGLAYRAGRAVGTAAMRTKDPCRR